VQYTIEPGIINYNVEIGPFGSIGPDAPFPGLPQVVGPETESVAMEALAYVELRKGVHCWIVNSDDGFRVTPALCAADPNNSRVLGEFNAGRGSSDTPFVFNVAEDGLYPARLIWEQGGGGANVEWVTIQSGLPSRAAINGNDGIKAFRPSALFTAVVVAHKLHIVWPSGAPCNWTLQSTTELKNPSSATIWTDIVGGSPQDIPLTGPAMFFRLVHH
jgi:hypothetical protein